MPKYAKIRVFPVNTTKYARTYISLKAIRFVWTIFIDFINKINVILLTFRPYYVTFDTILNVSYTLINYSEISILLRSWSSEKSL